MNQHPAQPPISDPNDLWAAIEQLSQPPKRKQSPGRKPTADTNEVELERRLIEALCAPMRPRWKDIAQVLIVHHWRCACGEQGTFPNFDPSGHRKVRRTAPDGAAWICSTDHLDPSLPIEHYPVFHDTHGCPSCIRETDPQQQQLPLGEPQPLRLRNDATICRREVPYV